LGFPTGWSFTTQQATLITNVIKGIDERFDSAANIAPLLTPFPTFLNFRNMLLIQEMKVAHRTTNTSASAFVAKGPVPPPLAGGLPPPSTGGREGGAAVAC
jgi:hypothetical protein